MNSRRKRMLETLLMFGSKTAPAFRCLKYSSAKMTASSKNMNRREIIKRNGIRKASSIRTIFLKDTAISLIEKNIAIGIKKTARGSNKAALVARKTERNEF